MAFASANGTRFFNQRWNGLQTPETRNDPKTVTKRLFSWSVNPETGRAGLKVPKAYERYLQAVERAQLKEKSEMIDLKYIEPDGRLSPESTGDTRDLGNGGGQGGGGGRGND
jgi:hypothetical protein